MKKIISYLILTFFFVVVITPNTYAEVTPNDVSLTLDQAVELALKQSNRLKQIEYDIERGEEVRKSAFDKVSYIPSGPAEPQVSAAFTGLLAIDMGLQMSKKSKDLEKDKIILNVFNKYTDVLTANENLELAKLQLEKAKKDWQITLLSYDAGIISKSQLKLAESGHKTANTSFELAQKEVDKAYQGLNSLIGYKPQDRPVLTEKVEFNPIEVNDLNHEIVRIMDGNPAIWLAEQQVDLAEIQLDLYNWADPTREPYEAKKIDIEKAKLTAADSKKQMRDGLYSLYQTIVQLEDNYKMLEQALKIAEEDFKLKKLQYDVGMISKQDYLSSELALAKAEKDFNKIVYQHESLKRTFYKPWAAMQ